jgi:hypothetical protein
MKISGPGSKPPVEGPGGVEGAAEPNATEGVSGKEFAEKIGRTGAAEASRAGEVTAPGLVADISAELRAGRLTPAAAIEKVIDRVLDQQVGPSAPAAVREQVGAALRRALEEDPLLVEKLREMGG